MTNEKRYQFKKDLLNVHKAGLCDKNAVIADDEFVISDGFEIVVLCDIEPVIRNAVKDFIDFLSISMDVCSIMVKSVKNSEKCLKITIKEDIEEASGYMGYRITVSDNGITLEGHDQRGVAQGLYFLEDLMSVRRAPFLKKQTIKRRALFSPRFSHSPFGTNEWTDEALLHLAHAGMDTITLWIKDINLDLRKSCIDMPLLIDRAERYGIDVNIMLYQEHSAHPDDEGAEKFYDNMYGKIFKACPKIKSIFLVGEADEFHSKDPNAGLAPRIKNFVDNIPTGKTTPGWYPCSDYPEWVSLIQRVIRKYNPDVDIIFSTYNWGFADKDKRVSLIENLPSDISMEVAWGMFEKHKVGNSVEETADYSLSLCEPGYYFTTEAEAAKKRGIKVVADCQCSGRTWDFGVIPYEPMPYQWLKRYKEMLKAKKDYDIAGITENIHYAFQPSIISELEKYMFFTEYEGAPTAEEWLRLLIERDYGKENADSVDKAFRLFSEAITHYVATNEDQYGAFRIGPAYPLWVEDTRIGLTRPPQQGKIPAEHTAMFGNIIYFPAYTPHVTGRDSLVGVRIFDELEAIKKVIHFMEEGVAELIKISKKNEAVEKLIALGKFISNTCKTAINEKELYINIQKLSIAENNTNASTIVDKIEQILKKERENVLDTIPITRVDSRLGWEASMEYQGDEKCLEWKLRQLDFDLNFTLPKYRKSIALK